MSIHSKNYHTHRKLSRFLSSLTC